VPEEAGERQALLDLLEEHLDVLAVPVALPKKLVSLPEGDNRITEAWRILFQRKPTAAETQRTKAFLVSYPADNAEKWAAQVHVLMASNEFLHVD
jgi:hypothetical protein